MRGGVPLLENQNSPVVSQPVHWVGGRTALVISATAYPIGRVLFQGLGSDPSKWINLNSASITADGFYIYDLPAGQYRMSVGNGTVTAMYAKLVAIPYTM